MAASYRRNFAANLPENQRSNELADLCVFGYSCKLFRDDERWLQMNDPSTLIPWMGDQRLLIDRFDGRGHLFSLDEYDVQNYKPIPATDEEKAIEKACDEERYLELHVDVREREMYEEEEVKRLYESLNDDSTYTAVQFSYNDPGPASKTSPVKHVYDEDTEPFVCPPELTQLLPASIILPPTAKLNSIIVKTALFVSEHGGQFEIMIKTKQKDNIQFRFMDIDHALNHYYKLMIDLIKSRKYIPPAEPPPEEEKTEQRGPMENVEPTPVEEEYESSSDDEGGHYLHPSLMSKNKPAPKPVPQRRQQQEEFLYYQYPQYPSVPAPTIIPPPPNLKPIIDKMAEYVAKNGGAFEQNVKQKGDSRFEFLIEGHMFYPYYMAMKEKFTKIVKEESERQQRHSDDVQQGKTGVSFSIKSKEPEPSIKPKPASVRLAEESESESSDSESDPRVETRGETIPRGGSESRDSHGSRTSTPTRVDESRGPLRTLKVDHGEDSIPDVLENRLDANGAQKDNPNNPTQQVEKTNTSHKDKLAERKRKALAFVNLLKRAKTDGSLNLDISNSPNRCSSRGSNHSPLPELPDI